MNSDFDYTSALAQNIYVGVICSRVEGELPLRPFRGTQTSRPRDDFNSSSSFEPCDTAQGADLSYGFDAELGFDHPCAPWQTAHMYLPKNIFPFSPESHSPYAYCTGTLPSDFGAIPADGSLRAYGYPSPNDPLPDFHDTYPAEPHPANLSAEPYSPSTSSTPTPAHASYALDSSAQRAAHTPRSLPLPPPIFPFMHPPHPPLQDLGDPSNPVDLELHRKFPLLTAPRPPRGMLDPLYELRPEVALEPEAAMAVIKKQRGAVKRKEHEKAQTPNAIANRRSRERRAEAEHRAELVALILAREDAYIKWAIAHNLPPDPYYAPEHYLPGPDGKIRAERDAEAHVEEWKARVRRAEEMALFVKTRDERRRQLHEENMRLRMLKCQLEDDMRAAEAQARCDEHFTPATTAVFGTPYGRYE